MMTDIVNTHLCTTCNEYYEEFDMASIEEHICEACATAADYATLLEESEKQQAELAQLRDQLADMTNSQHVNERSLDEYARTIARLRAQLTDIKCNGYIPARDTVGGVISSEWDTPEEDAAWAHLEEGGGDE